MARFEVDVILHCPLDAERHRFLDSVVRSANRVVRFTGDDHSIRLTVDVGGMTRDDALRAAAGEVARTFPASRDERYVEIRQTTP